jgi:hypothetical protein
VEVSGRICSSFPRKGGLIPFLTELQKFNIDEYLKGFKFSNSTNEFISKWYIV